jgi:hypothetical protein
MVAIQDMKKAPRLEKRNAFFIPAIPLARGDNPPDVTGTNGHQTTPIKPTYTESIAYGAPGCKRYSAHHAILKA